LESGRNPFINGTSGWTANLIAAYSHQSILAQHDYHSVSALSVDFVGGSSVFVPATASPYSSLRILHGVIQAIAFGFIFPLGMAVARFGRWLGRWFQIHRAIQITGYVAACIGFTIAFVMVEGAHFNVPFHGYVGISLMILVTMQGLYGFCRPHKDEAAFQQSFPRTVFEWVHPIIGYCIIYPMALVQIFSGLVYLPASLPVIITIATIIFVVLIGCIAFEIARRRRWVPMLTEAVELQSSRKDPNYLRLGEQRATVLAAENPYKLGLAASHGSGAVLSPLYSRADAH